MIIRRILNKIEYYSIIFSKIFYSYITYIKFYFFNVSLGTGNKFYGVPKLIIDSKSSIKIGNNNTFRSNKYSNPIGLNHKCILSVTSASRQHPAILTVGNNCGFSGTTIWCFCKINIGNNVRVGANSMIVDGDAHFDDKRTSPPQPIIIEDDVFVGANCVIKKGVHIGACSIIGMNSIVTKDIPANCVAVGVPAKVIKKL